MQLKNRVEQFYPIGSVKGWRGASQNNHMVPEIEYFNASEAREYVDAQWSEDVEITAEPGWYHRLTAPGYLDATDWSGPFPTAYRCLRDCLRTYDIDTEGNSI